MGLKRSTFAKLADKFVNVTFEDFTKTAVINQPVTVEDGQGGRSRSWVLFATIKCFVFPMVGSENVDAGRFYTDQDFKFSFEPVAGVNTKMQVVYDGEVYGITSIEDLVEADVWMELITQRNPAQ
jgi:SPP1 family predicted phage head-tail adaptor